MNFENINIMKRNIQIVAATVATLLAFGCTPENVAPEPEPQDTVVDTVPMSDTNVYSVGSYFCNGFYIAEIIGADAWGRFLDSVFNSVEGGCKVMFWNDAMVLGSHQQLKERPCRNFTDRDSARIWCEQRYFSGHSVIVTYDSCSDVYTCAATRLVPLRTDWEPVPLADFLLGTWAIDQCGRFFYNEDDSTYTCDPYFTSLNSPRLDTLVFTTDSVYLSSLVGVVGHNPVNEYVITDNEHIIVSMASYNRPARIMQLGANSMLVDGLPIRNSGHFEISDIYIFNRVN